MEDSSSFVSPLNTKGQIFTYSTLNAAINVGSNGQVLTADSTTNTGLKWSSVGGIASAGTISTSVVAGGAAANCGDELFTSTDTTADAKGALKGSSVIATGATIQVLDQKNQANQNSRTSWMGITDALVSQDPRINGDGAGFDCDGTTERLRCTNGGTSTTSVVAYAETTRLWRKLVWTSATSVVFSEQDAATGAYVALGTVATNVPDSTTMTFMDWVQNDNPGPANAALHTIYKVLVS